MAPRLSRAVAVAFEISEDDWKEERRCVRDVARYVSRGLNMHEEIRSCTSEEDLEPDLVRDMKTLSSLMMTK